MSDITERTYREVKEFDSWVYSKAIEFSEALKYNLENCPACSGQDYIEREVMKYTRTLIRKLK